MAMITQDGTTIQHGKYRLSWNVTLERWECFAPDGALFMRARYLAEFWALTGDLKHLRDDAAARAET